MREALNVEGGAAPASARGSSIDELKSAVAAVAHRVFERGLVAGSGGNISVRVRGRDEFLITRTGISMGDVRADDVLSIDAQGRADAPNGLCPSIETPIHLSTYRLRPDVQAVIHLHPPYSVVMSLKAEPLPLVTVSARLLLRYVPCVPVAYPETDRLHAAMEAVLERCPEAGVVLMAAHGLTAWGPDLTAAFDLADLCEATARQAYMARAAGLRFRLPEPEEL
jgi:L-fuculose-phosphate aldolase